MARRRAHNSNSIRENDEDEMEHHSGKSDTVIILPRIVRDFSEGKITEETSDFFIQILSGWFYDQLYEIFVKNENIIYSSH